MNKSKMPVEFEIVTKDGVKHNMLLTWCTSGEFHIYKGFNDDWDKDSGLLLKIIDNDDGTSMKVEVGDKFN